MKPLLSILIPTTPDRFFLFHSQLLKNIRLQIGNISIKEDTYFAIDIEPLKNTSMSIEECIKMYYEQGIMFAHTKQVNMDNIDYYTSNNNEVEVIVYTDDKILTIGEKRGRLYQLANGDFSLQLDSDDDISDNAIELILNAIKSNPDVDCITFEERVRLDGVEYKSNHSNEYVMWEGDGQKVLSDGFHFHRTPFFKDVIRTELAKSVPIVHCRFGEDNLYANDLRQFIKTEFHINQQLYYYNYVHTPHNERYGIKEM